MASRDEQWIMVVDDSPDMRNLLTFLLRQLGWNRIERAVGGKDALTKLQAAPDRYSLMLTD